MYASDQLVCKILESEWCALPGQSCVKSGLWLFVVIFLPVVHARAGTNEQNRHILAWLGSLCYWALGLFWSIVIKNKHHQKKKKKMKVTITGKRNYNQKYNLLAFTSNKKSKRLWRKNTFHFVPSGCAKLACKTALAISNQWPRLLYNIFKVCLSQQPLHNMDGRWNFLLLPFWWQQVGGRFSLMLDISLNGFNRVPWEFRSARAKRLKKQNIIKLF